MTEDYSSLEKVILCLLCVFNCKRGDIIFINVVRNCKMGMSGNIDEYGLPSFEKFEIYQISFCSLGFVRICLPFFEGGKY